MEYQTNKPIYLQIADSILEKIISNRLSPADRLLSIRDAAVESSVNPNTVSRTYQYLQNQNIIFNKRGIGYFISDEAKERALSILKERFIKEEVPRIKKQIQYLNLSIQDLYKIINHENK